MVYGLIYYCLMYFDSLGIVYLIGPLNAYFVVKTETWKGSCDVIDSGILLGPSPELPVKYQCQFNIIARRDCRVLY